MFLTFGFLSFQPPIVILHATVLEARNLEAKDADGKARVFLFFVLPTLRTQCFEN